MLNLDKISSLKLDYIHGHSSSFWKTWNSNVPRTNELEFYLKIYFSFFTARRALKSGNPEAEIKVKEGQKLFKTEIESLEDRIRIKALSIKIKKNKPILTAYLYLPYEKCWIETSL